MWSNAVPSPQSKPTRCKSANTHIPVEDPGQDVCAGSRLSLSPLSFPWCTTALRSWWFSFFLFSVFLRLQEPGGAEGVWLRTEHQADLALLEEGFHFRMTCDHHITIWLSESIFTKYKTFWQNLREWKVSKYLFSDAHERVANGLVFSIAPISWG